MRVGLSVAKGCLWVILAGIFFAWLFSALRNPRLVEAVSAIAFSPDGSTLAAGTDDGTVVEFDTKSWRRLNELKLGRFSNRTSFVAYSVDGRILAASGDRMDLVIWDAATRTQLAAWEIPFGQTVNCGAISPDGHEIAIGGEGDTIRIWSWKAGSTIREIITSHKSRINAIAYSPDGKLLATGSDDESIKLTNVVTGQEVVTFVCDHEADVHTSVRSVAFSPDGKSLLAGTGKGKALIWDVETKEEPLVLQPHGTDVGTVAYSRNGQRFATGCWDGTVSVFDATTKAPLRAFTADPRWLWCVDLAPDGGVLATGGTDGMIKILNLSSGRSTRIVVEPSTAHWWVLAVVIWGLAYAWVRAKTPVAATRIVVPSEERPVSTLPDASRVPDSNDTNPIDIRSKAILVIGGCIYGLICLPAIGQRGYPPIDPAWTGVTYLWVSPLLLAELLTRQRFRQRVLGLAIYCFATGYIDAASVVMFVPKFVDPLITLVETLIFFGPMHLAIGMVLSGAVTGIRRLAKRSRPQHSHSGRKIFPWLATVGVMVLTVAFPFAFQQYIFSDMANRGRSQADADWNAKSAVRYVKDFPESGEITHEFDLETGLKLRGSHHQPRRYSDAYSGRVDALLRERGIPEWSMKRFLVPDDVLRKLIDAEGFEEITNFPHEVNENIILFRRGTISRWGGSMSSESDSLSIATPHESMSMGDGIQAVAIMRSGEYPQIVFIRNGKHWLGVYHESGRQLSSLSR